MSERILVIEDDADVRRVVRAHLERAGFDVVGLESGIRLDHIVSNQVIKLAIVDLGLPGEDGLSLVRRLRTKSSMGIIILTGQGEPVDRVVGLELGADDYLAKPFEPRELIARVRAVLRRLKHAPGSPAEDELASKYRWDGWAFDPASQILTSPDGEIVNLTGGEIRLLSAFLSHPNRILTRDQIIDLVSSDDSPAFDRSIDVRVARLRKKLRNEDPQTSAIRTIRNYGYQFAAKLTRE